MTPEEKTRLADEYGEGDSDYDDLMASANSLFQKEAYAEAAELYDRAGKCEDAGWRAHFYHDCCIAYGCSYDKIPKLIEHFRESSESIFQMIVLESFATNKILPDTVEYMTQWLALNKHFAQRLSDSLPLSATDEQKAHYRTNVMSAFTKQLDHIDNWLTNPDLKEDTKDPEFISAITDIIVDIWNEIDKVFAKTLFMVDRLTDKQLLGELLDGWLGVMNVDHFRPVVLKKYPDHVIALEKRLKDRINELESRSGGCYVATAVYGSYDCAQVWTLRRFRDGTLAQTRCGRSFIRVYYAISPTLVKWFGETRWFKAMWKPMLDRLVNKLNAQGVENTPYEDRPW